MSIRALQALLGEDAVASMSADEVAALGEVLDAEIMRHQELRDRLARVVGEEVARIKADRDAAKNG